MPTPVGSFNVTQLGLKADKTGKDNNFRGMTVYNNVIYFTKGSGSNGVNTVYFIDTTGSMATANRWRAEASACLDQPRRFPPHRSPTTPPSCRRGVTPYNMCILKGFPTTPAKTATSFPFGVWFADAKTLYVADEGDGITPATGLGNTRPPPRRPEQDCRSGCSITSAPGNWPIRCGPA